MLLKKLGIITLLIFACVAALAAQSAKRPLKTFSIDGMDVGDVASKLMSDYGIHTVSIKSGVRVTPHVYTTTKDLDRFIDAVMKIAAS